MDIAYLTTLLTTQIASVENRYKEECKRQKRLIKGTLTFREYVSTLGGSYAGVYDPEVVTAQHSYGIRFDFFSERRKIKGDREMVAFLMPEAQRINRRVDYNSHHRIFEDIFRLNSILCDKAEQFGAEAVIDVKYHLNYHDAMKYCSASGMVLRDATQTFR